MTGWLWAVAAATSAALLAALGVFARRAWKRMEERRMARWQADLVARHVDEVEQMYGKMRGWRHDYHSHIQTMKAYFAMGRFDELEEYLGRLETDLTQVDTVIKTGNVKLDAILNSKLTLIASKQIAVNAKALVPGELTVSDVDLCVVIGNLMDNAIEACERVPEPEKRFIRVYVGILKQHLYISVANSAAEVKKVAPGQYESTKGSGRGFGLKRVDAIVRAHGGYLNRQSEPGVFATEVMLPL